MICTVPHSSPLAHISTTNKSENFIFAMAKFVFVAVLLIFAVAASTAAPAEEFQIQEMAEGAETFQNQEIEEREQHLRFRRVTCDLLSFGGVVGDSACAGNCLSMGKAGGSCNGGICECRRDTIKDLWNRRFG